MREFLASATSSLEGQPPIPEGDAVELRWYGTTWLGESAIRVVLVSNRAVPLDFRLQLQPSGPNPELVMLSREHAARVLEAAKAAQRDVDDLQALLKSRSASRETGSAQPTERQMEVLRLFGLEVVPGGLVAVGQLATAGAEKER